MALHADHSCSAMFAAMLPARSARQKSGNHTADHVLYMSY
jgi:hypothetical protein